MEPNASIILYDKDGNGFVLEYRLERDRHRSIRLTVAKDATVLVRAPYSVWSSQIEAFLQEKADWLLKNLIKQRRISEMSHRTALSPAAHKALEKRYRAAAQAYIPERVAHYAQQMGLTYGAVYIRSPKRQWGSCSSSGNLSFNWRLMLAPPRIVDYVVVHELAHRRHMDHSPAFWAAVEDVLPDYRECVEWLKENGDLLEVTALNFSS